MEKYCVCQTFVAALLLFGIVQATLILEHPKDVEAVPNEWVQFNCTVANCTDTVSWFIAGRSHAIKGNSSVPGLIIWRYPSMCTSSNHKTHFFEVQATKALNMSAFYCSANHRSHATNTSRCEADGRYFSRSALLRVNNIAPSQTLAGIPEMTFSPHHSRSLTLQERADSEAAIMTTTVAVTPTIVVVPSLTNPPPSEMKPEAITTTTTVTIALTVEITSSLNNCPSEPTPLCSQAARSSTQATSVKAAVLAGLGIAAFILLL